MDPSNWYGWGYGNVIEPYGMYNVQYPMQQPPQPAPQFSAYGPAMNSSQNQPLNFPNFSVNSSTHGFFPPNYNDGNAINKSNNAIDSIVMNAAVSNISYGKAMYPASQTSRARKFTNKGGKSHLSEVTKYCDLCKCSCAGEQAYNAHLEGKGHKKKQALTEQQKTGSFHGGKKEFYCELCQVYCSCYDAFVAHVNGSKHQKIYKLQVKLGKSLPKPPDTSGCPSKMMKGADEQAGSATTVKAENSVPSNNEAGKQDQSIGIEYIVQMMNSSGTTVQYFCKLCDCALSDMVARSMHLKGKRHKLQYKKKVNPAFEVEEDASKGWRSKGPYNKLKRKHTSYDKYKQGNNMRFEEETMQWRLNKSTNPGGGYAEGALTLYKKIPFEKCEEGGMTIHLRGISRMNQHIVHKHSLIYPSQEDLHAVQSLVGVLEKVLKLTSEYLHQQNIERLQTDEPYKETNVSKVENTNDTCQNHTINNSKNENDETTKANTKLLDITYESDKLESGISEDILGDTVSYNDSCLDACQNSSGPMRDLKGVVRMGSVAKGLLLRGGVMTLELMILTSKPPSTSLLTRVRNIMALKIKKIFPLKLCLELASGGNYMRVYYCGDNEDEKDLKLTMSKFGESEDSAFVDAHQQVGDVKCHNEASDCNEADAACDDTKQTDEEKNAALRCSLKNIMCHIYMACVNEVFPRKGNPDCDKEGRANDEKSGCSSDQASNDNIVESVDKPTHDSNELCSELSSWSVKELIRTKWFQTNVQQCEGKVLLLRVMIDLCKRISTWNCLPQIALELLVDKAYNIDLPSSPALALKRLLEIISSGLLLKGGTGLVDRVTNATGPEDAVACMTEQQREDLTNSAQHALRLITFNQIHKLLGIEES